MTDKRISALAVVARKHVCDHGRVKKYLLFTYYVGRPLGGAKDFLDSFDSIEEALDNILEEWTRYYQVVDRDTMETVREGLARFKNFAPEGFKSNDPQADGFGPNADSL